MARINHACEQCGSAFSRDSQARFCWECVQARSKIRLASPDRERTGNYKPLRVDGKFACLECQEPVIHTAGKRPCLRCWPCNHTRWVWKDVLSGRTLAAAAVSMARKRGTLADPFTLTCVDCGRRAECYDHRDYNAPLSVDPVCRSCNVMRGSAKPFNPWLVSALILAGLPA